MRSTSSVECHELELLRRPRFRDRGSTRYEAMLRPEVAEVLSETSRIRRR